MCAAKSSLKKILAFSTPLALLLGVATACAADYDPAHCAAVAGTLNIFWEEVAGPQAPCGGIEFTNGMLADAADGSITMTGVSVSNITCFGNAAYSLTQSADRLSLSGLDTLGNVPMTLTLSSDHACYVGHWISDGLDYVATISAAPFPQAALPALTPAPFLGARLLSLLAGFLALLGCMSLARIVRR